MSGVTIAVLTYRRPDDLAAILPMLVEQALRAPIPARVLVIDNDPGGGARAHLETLIAGGQPIRYVHEPEPGIAAARNRAIDETLDADLLVFIDDDERPVDGWLQALLDTH